MLEKIPLLNHTQQSYVAKVVSVLGKGAEHASLFYQEFFRTGQITRSHPAFKNGPAVFQEIIDLTDFSLPEIVKKNDDGFTGKFLLKIEDNLEVESVMIPMKAGGTLCISSQVGCRLGCAFCETGKMGLLRNLTPAQIVAQVYIARHVMGFDLRNIVFMGMGEPFDNYDHVMQAARILQCPGGFGLGRTHISISTSGCVDGIEKFTAEGLLGPNLAVSINAPNDSIRQKLMPITKKYPMAVLHEAMRSYCNATGRQILAAYVLLKGVNDAVEHAEELADYLQGLNVKVNLIPYNPQTRDRFQPPDDQTIEVFSSRLRERGYYTLVRSTKGQKIMAACGQLGNLELRKLIFNKDEQHRIRRQDG